MLATLLVRIEVPVEVIGEEKQLQNNEHDEQLDQDDQPCLFAPGIHAAETVIIKPENTGKNILSHRPVKFAPKVEKI